MKAWKKIFGIILLGGLLWGIWGAWGIWEKEKQREATGLERQVQAEQPIKFAVMSDVHSDWNNFQKALQNAKGDGVEFLIITGDLTTLGMKNELLEAKKYLDESGLKYYLVPGNHDVWWGRKNKQNVWQEVFGESYLSFRVSKLQSSKDGEVKFILLNNGDGVGGFEGFGGKGQLLWLKKEIEECSKIYCLVFIHMPLNHPNSIYIMGEDNPKIAGQAAELIKLFVDNNVAGIFAGHLHYSSDYKKDNLKTNIVGAVASDRNFQSPKFLEVEINGGKMNINEVFIE